MKQIKQVIGLLFVVGLSVLGHAQIGMGTTTPNTSAVLDLNSTTAGLLPPRMTFDQMNAIVSPAEGLIVYCSNCDPKGLYYFDGTGFLSGITGGVPAVPVVSTTGATWMDRNLGATQVATSSTDAASYGDLYQWGRAADGHEKRNSVTTTTLATIAVPDSGNLWHGKYITTSADWLSSQDDNLWEGINGSNNPCPSGYRVPTSVEWEAERNNGGTGYWGTGSFQNNSTGAFESALKLPTAGYRAYTTGSLGDEGVRGDYWSSTVNGSGVIRLLFLSTVSTVANTSFRANGYAVRCIKD